MGDCIYTLPSLTIFYEGRLLLRFSSPVLFFSGLPFTAGHFCADLRGRRRAFSPHPISALSAQIRSRTRSYFALTPPLPEVEDGRDDKGDSELQRNERSGNHAFLQGRRTCSPDSLEIPSFREVHWGALNDGIFRRSRVLP